MGTWCQGQFNLAYLPFSCGPVLDVGITAPGEEGYCCQAGIFGGGLKCSPCHWKDQLALMLDWFCSFLPWNILFCFWKLSMENGVKWNNNVLRWLSSDLGVFLSSQLFTGDGRRDLSHTRGTNVLPTLQIPMVWCGAVLPLMPGSRLCGTACHRPVFYCCIHSLSSRLKMLILCTSGNTIRKNSQVTRQCLMECLVWTSRRVFRTAIDNILGAKFCFQ